MSITPDNKNWTWVLERPCPDCAFDAETIANRDIGMIIRDVASQWEVVLFHPQVRQRPLPNVWSPLEYGCHVRDRQDPHTVRRELATSGDMLADRFDAVSGSEWRRVGFRSDGAQFTVESFGRYLLHDPIHHLWDVAHIF